MPLRNTMDEASLQFLVETAKANAQINDSDDEIEFFPGSPAYPEVETYNAALDDPLLRGVHRCSPAP